MPRLRYTGGGTYRVGGYGFEPGGVNDVDGELAEYLADREDFEVVDDVAEERGEGEFRFDPGEATDFSTNGWLDNNYQDRVEAVQAGGLDEYLDEIENAETSETVIDAVQKRRVELEA